MYLKKIKATRTRSSAIRRFFVTKRCDSQLASPTNGARSGNNLFLVLLKCGYIREFSRCKTRPFHVSEYLKG